MTYYQENRRYWTSGMEKFYQEAKQTIAENLPFKITQSGLLSDLYTKCLIASDDKGYGSITFCDVMAVINTLILDNEIEIGNSLVPKSAE